jgi:hypothetical protein
MKEMEQADVAVMLISPGYLTARFIQEMEVPLLLKFRRESRLCVMPLLVEHCVADEVEWLRGLESRPRGTFLSDLSRVRVERELAALTREILRMARKKASAPRGPEA